MEREFSNRSLSSRGGSEMGSQYVMETGLSMSSFAATIFIAALATVGVLFITLLIALAVMLQTCENRSKGIVEIPKANVNYYYCNIFFLHAELNGLDFNDFPEICKATAVLYIKDGQYARDFNITMEIADNYFTGIKPAKDGRVLVLIDIDDFIPSTSLSNGALYRFNRFGCDDCLEEAKNMKSRLILKLYTKLQASGWPLILLSRNHEKERNATVERLISAGYSGWSSLVMRLDVEMQIASREYFSGVQKSLQQQGFYIFGVISSRMEALTAPYSGCRLFKLPNPIYHAFRFAQ